MNREQREQREKKRKSDKSQCLIFSSNNCNSTTINGYFIEKVVSNILAWLKKSLRKSLRRNLIKHHHRTLLCIWLWFCCGQRIFLMCLQSHWQLGNESISHSVAASIPKILRKKYETILRFSMSGNFSWTFQACYVWVASLRSPIHLSQKGRKRYKGRLYGISIRLLCLRKWNSPQSFMALSSE